MKDILIIGAGDQCKIIIDMLSNSKAYRVLGMIDVLGKKGNLDKKILGKPILGSMDDVPKYAGSLSVVAIGDCEKRRKLVAAIKPSLRFVTLIHPRAYVSKSVVIGEGSMISVNAVINPNASIGQHCIINTAATIDHDCRIGDFVSVSPGVHIAGNVVVGQGTLIGIGASVKDNVRIGKNCVIGAGAVVIDDIPDNSIAVGVPAKAVGTSVKKIGADK